MTISWGQGGCADDLPAPSHERAGPQIVSPTPTSKDTRPKRSRRSVRPRHSQTVEQRDVEPADMASKLRGILGLPPEEPAPGEEAAIRSSPMPPLIRNVDAGGWIAWCLVGLPLFAERFPSLGAVRHAAKRLIVVLAIERSRGDDELASRMLRMSSKALRENLRRLGFKPAFDFRRMKRRPPEPITTCSRRPEGR